MQIDRFPPTPRMIAKRIKLRRNGTTNLEWVALLSYEDAQDVGFQGSYREWIEYIKETRRGCI